MGAAYILSSDLVEYLSLNAPKFKLFYNEDVSIGTWLAPIRVNR